MIALEPMSQTSSRDRYSLYGAKTGNCFRVAIGLEEAGIEYTPIVVDLMGGEQRGHAHRSLNPMGKVPVLAVNRAGGERFVLTQSNAILLHLDQLRPGLLLPQVPDERARALERFMFFLTDVIGPNHGAFKLRAPNITHGSLYLENIALRGIDYSESFLRESKFIGGSRFSLADIVAFTIINSMRDRIDWPNMPRLAKWFREVTNRPAVVRGMNAFDL
jgi:GST-like protein